MLFGLYFILHPQIPTDQLKDFGIGNLGLFLVAAYVGGHIVRAVGDVLERLFWCLFGGMPSEWVLTADAKTRGGLISDGQRSKLGSEIVKLGYKFDTFQINANDGCSGRREKFGQWQGVTRQVSMKVHDAKHATRVDAFNRTYGMMIGITVALLIVCVALLVKSYSDFGWTRTTIGAVIAFVVAPLCGYRAYLFGKHYARALYVAFLDL